MKNDLKLSSFTTHVFENVHPIGKFATYEIEIDFENPDKSVEEQLAELTLQVENQCPVAEAFGIKGMGEGIVWEHVFDYDDTVQIVSVRDFQEEAEICAGMIQEMLKSNSDLSLSDVGVLLPSDFEYSLVLKNTFEKSGILTSGLRADIWKKDLGREALYHFIYCRQSPSPAMAMSVCLSSVLMPWSH